MLRQDIEQLELAIKSNQAVYDQLVKEVKVKIIGKIQEVKDGAQATQALIRKLMAEDVQELKVKSVAVSKLEQSKSWES